MRCPLRFVRAPHRRLQELATDDKTEAGRIPRTIDVELAAHLVDTCLPGDVISIGGIVKVVTTEEGGTVRRECEGTRSCAAPRRRPRPLSRRGLRTQDGTSRTRRCTCCTSTPTR